MHCGSCEVAGFTLVALCTLALGIGANTAIYSVIHGALRLPYDNASRIVAVENVYPQGSYFANSWPDFLQWRSQEKSFAELAATFTVRSTWTGAGEPQLLNVGLASDGYFGVYGVGRFWDEHWRRATIKKVPRRRACWLRIFGERNSGAIRRFWASRST